MKASRGVLLLLLVAIAAGDEGALKKGKKLFKSIGEWEYTSCAHCHAVVAAEKERKETDHIRPGPPLLDTAHRGKWKTWREKKTFESAAAAGAHCAEVYQGRKLSAEQTKALDAYLRSISPGKDVKPLDWKYKTPLPESLDGGDAAKGEKKVALFCGGCHGPTDDHYQAELRKGRYKKAGVAQRVRGYTSPTKFKPEGRQMSFFGKERLSDEDLLDILAYLGR